MWWLIGIGTVVLLILGVFGYGILSLAYEKQPETTLPEYEPD